jgi:hypothetical protein
MFILKGEMCRFVILTLGMCGTKMLQGFQISEQSLLDGVVFRWI